MCNVDGISCCAILEASIKVFKIVIDGVIGCVMDVIIDGVLDVIVDGVIDGVIDGVLAECKVES